MDGSPSRTLSSDRLVRSWSSPRRRPRPRLRRAGARRRFHRAGARVEVEEVAAGSRRIAATVAPTAPGGATSPLPTALNAPASSIRALLGRLVLPRLRRAGALRRADARHRRLLPRLLRHLLRPLLGCVVSLAVAQQEIVKADFAAAARAIARGSAVVSSGSALQQASHGDEQCCGICNVFKHAEKAAMPRLAREGARFKHAEP